MGRYLASAVPGVALRALDYDVARPAAAWLLELMGLPHTHSGRWLASEDQCLVLACACAITARFPSFDKLGFQSFGGTLPRFYAASPHAQSALLRALRVLGLPAACLERVASAATTPGLEETMDADALEGAINADVAA